MSDISAFLADASDLLGPRGLTRDQDIMAPWLTDWRGRFTGKALAMASPATTQEVADLVKLCARHGVAIVPQGGNSGMCGGATPGPEGHELLLSLRRMNAIRSIDPHTRQTVCEAGVILQSLHDAAAEQGLRFALTLGGKGSATIGGLISTNAGGTQVLRHGTMRAMVLGLEAVLPDGNVYSALTPLKKDNRGFDLKQLLIGSEGTLGVITAATLSLVPAVADRAVVWVGLASLQDARKLLLTCDDIARDALEGFEVLPQSCLESVLAHVPGSRPPLAEPHAWHALIEVVADATSAPGLGGLVESMMAAAFSSGLAEDAVLASSEAQAEAFWRLRDEIAAAERARGPALQHDISVPVERMPEFVEMIVPVTQAAWPGAETVAFGHLGDGNVHLHVIAPPGTDYSAIGGPEAKAISNLVYDLVTQWGGSLSAEHGIGQLKRDDLERLGDPVALALMRKVKHAIDPDGLLNPGKVVTLAPQRPSA